MKIRGKPYLPAWLALPTLIFTMVAGAVSRADDRELVAMPPMMQAHMLANMRDHLAAINEILGLLARDDVDAAAEVAEQRLGMSSLDDHGASRMAAVMPDAMQAIGTGMHRAASRFALKAQEGELQPALEALQAVTSACVSCHTGYRVR